MFEFILFDLDDTLYPRSAGLMDEVGLRIQVWLCDHLDLSWEEARRLRRAYYHQYGTTLGGLVAEHEIDASNYLFFVHDIPLHTYLAPNPALAEMLQSIPLRKVIYTNATSDYGWRVLETLGVRDHFEQVFGIEEVCLRNKPYQEAYEQVLLALDAWGPTCIMVEDSARNLHPAKALGMRTVLVGSQPDRHVDFWVPSVLDVGDVVTQILEDK